MPIAGRAKRIKEKRKQILWNIKQYKEYRKAVINLTLDAKPFKWAWDNPQVKIAANKKYMKTLIGIIMGDLYYMDRIYLHKVLKLYFKRTFH